MTKIVIVAGVLVVVGIVVILLSDKAAKHIKKCMKNNNVILTGNELPASDSLENKALLCGEVVNVTVDEKTGLTRIEVIDDLKMSQIGLSRQSVQEINALYAGKGKVQIPVVCSTDSGTGKLEI